MSAIFSELCVNYKISIDAKITVLNFGMLGCTKRSISSEIKKFFVAILFSQFRAKSRPAFCIRRQRCKFIIYY